MAKPSGVFMKIEFWRRSKTGKGSATVFNISNEGGTFVSMWPQKPNTEEFNYGARITASLGIKDLGAMVSVLRGTTGGLGTQNENGMFGGLMHTNRDKTSSTIINLSFDKDGKLWFGLSKKAEGEDLVRFGTVLSPADAEELRVFIEQAMIAAMVARSAEEQQERSTYRNDNQQQNAPAAKPAAPAPAVATTPRAPAKTNAAETRSAAPKKPTTPNLPPRAQQPAPAAVGATDEADDDNGFPV
jgi:hypothetical protein